MRLWCDAMCLDDGPTYNSKITTSLARVDHLSRALIGITWIGLNFTVFYLLFVIS